MRRILSVFGALPLRAKGALLMGFPLGALLVAMLLFYGLWQQASFAEGWVEHTLEVHSELQQIVTLSVNAETAVRGYALARRTSFLEPYSQSRQQLPGHLRTLQTLISDNPAQLVRLRTVEALVTANLNELDRLRRRSDEGRPLDPDQLEADKAGMDNLRRELDTMEQVEQGLLAERTDRERQTRQRWRFGILFGGLLGLAGGSLGGLFFFSGIVQRVGHLEEDARRVADGLPVSSEVHGGDEIAGLARVLSQTSERLLAQAEELRAAKRDLESRVEQRTAELLATNESLRQANDVRQAVIQASPLAIWALDLEGKVRFWNPAAERIFGWQESELLGRMLPIVQPDQQEEYQRWLEGFRLGVEVAGVERSRLKKDGSRIEVAIWTASLRDAEGRISGTIFIDSDVTERNRLEAQFRQSQKLEAIGQLAGGVAHDFNNLLTIMTGYVEMLLDELRDNPTLAEYAGEMKFAANRATALTKQLLAFSRRQMSQPQILDLNETVAHSMKLLRRVIGEDIQISTHFYPQLASVHVDPTHIDQILMNLVVNARDAMPGGGQVTIETANVTLDQNYLDKHLGVKPGPYVLLAVSDTGGGISPETKERLFEPFFTTKQVGGTGLGLSIVYGIVKQNQGEIGVYSELGQGTTFKIYLPAVQAPADASPEETVGLAEAGGSETILVCEDEVPIRKLIHSMLTKLGYHVLVADSPEKAMEIVSQNGGDIHLLLTDVVMPQTNGFELAKMVRAVRPGIRVLYMSGYTDHRLTSSWIVEPGTPLLQKPFTAPMLDQQIRGLLGEKRAGAGPQQ